MKLKMWALVAAAVAVSTPALAASDGGKGSPAVWIALGTVFMGVFTTLIAVLVAAKAKKKPSGE